MYLMYSARYRVWNYEDYYSYIEKDEGEAGVKLNYPHVRPLRVYG